MIPLLCMAYRSAEVMSSQGIAAREAPCRAAASWEAMIGNLSPAEGPADSPDPRVRVWTATDEEGGTGAGIGAGATDTFTSIPLSLTSGRCLIARWRGNLEASVGRPQ
ncbi:hypothetical protein GCM10027456_73070 [Kineosporia babensis]